MTILTHAVVAGLLGAEIKNPVLASLAGLSSHFVLDLIPHNDYFYVYRNERSPNPYTTLVSWGLLGLTLIFLLFEFIFLDKLQPGRIVLASLWGMLPDAYTGIKVTFKLGNDPFDRFHNFIHHHSSFSEMLHNRQNPSLPTDRQKSLKQNYLILKKSLPAKIGWLFETVLELIVLFYCLALLRTLILSG